jgi:hypothetical protein
LFLDPLHEEIEDTTTIGDINNGNNGATGIGDGNIDVNIANSNINNGAHTFAAVIGANNTIAVVIGADSNNIIANTNDNNDSVAPIVEV